MIIISLVLFFFIFFTIILTIIIIINHICVNKKTMAVGYLPPFLKEVLIWLVVYLPL